MVALKRIFMLAASLALALMLAGCGGSTATTRNRPAVKPTAPYITIMSTKVNGKAQAILATATGLTLYYDTADSATTSGCSSQCGADWRPLLFAGPGAPIAPPKLPGALSLRASGGGSQIEYNGHPLYTYMQDTTPGELGGQGALGKWFVATPSLPRNA